MSRQRQKTRNKILQSIMKHGLEQIEEEKRMIEISIWSLTADTGFSRSTIYAYSRELNEKDIVPFHKVGFNMEIFPHDFKHWIKNMKKELEEKEEDESEEE